MLIVWVRMVPVRLGAGCLVLLYNFTCTYLSSLFPALLLRSPQLWGSGSQLFCTWPALIREKCFAIWLPLQFYFFLILWTFWRVVTQDLCHTCTFTPSFYFWLQILWSLRNTIPWFLNESTLSYLRVGSMSYMHYILITNDQYAFAKWVIEWMNVNYLKSWTYFVEYVFGLNMVLPNKNTYTRRRIDFAFNKFPL